jgi:hypothetical protein
MNMKLFFHLSIHVAFGLLAGFLVWRIYRRPFWSFLCSIMAGVFVDFDHFIDYFLAFGWSFNLYYFNQGFEFLKSNKIYIVFHGWEYVAVLIVLWLIAKNRTAKTIFLALALGLFVHLSADVYLDKVPVKFYSIIYRAENNFDLEKLATPEHWEKHQRNRKALGFE